MDPDAIYRFKIVSIVIVFGYIAYLAYNNKNIMETFETKSGSTVNAQATGMSNVSGIQSDTLLISKYKKDYDTLLTNCEKNLNQSIIQQLLQIDTSQDATSSNNLKIYEQINVLNSTKTALPNVLTFINSS